MALTSSTANLLSLSSVQTRERLAIAFSAIRRVRPRVPFFKLSAHRIPTRWSLYRGLLQSLPGVNTRYQRVYDVKGSEWDSRRHGQAILWWIRMSFREQRHVTSPQTCRKHLIFWHKLLDTIRLAPTDAKKREILVRYERLIAAHKERLEMEVLYQTELARIERMRNKPIMSGGYLRPSVNNRPLPRFYRQPLHITMMIRSRIKSKIRRLARQTELYNRLDDLKAEGIFQKSLWEHGGYDTEEDLGAYGAGTKSVLDTINASFHLDRERATSVYTPEMLASIKRARTFKIENKTRERQRELRGEITNRVLKRMRQGPPAHVLQRMSAEERQIDRVMREVSLGGDSGRIKVEERAKRRNKTLSTRDTSSTAGE